MSVHTTENGRWFVMFRVGKKTKKEYFGRGLEAEAKARARNEELKLRSWTKRTPKYFAPTFSEIAAAYIEAKQGNITLSSIENLLYKLQGVILPELGNLPANKITYDRLDQYKNKRMKGEYWSRVQTTSGTKKVFRQPVKMTTIHREITDIIAILNWAAHPKRKIIHENPAALYDKPKRDDTEIKPVKLAEARAIIKHASPHVIRALYISYYTGLRPGLAEMFGLTWEDVDFETGTILITSARKGGFAKRNVPLHDDFLPVLQSWFEEDQKNNINYLITYKGQPVKSIKTAFNAAKRRAGINRRLTLYAFRHAFASALLSGSADLKSTSELLGHTRTETTTRIYQHTNTAMHKKAVGKLARLDDEEQNVPQKIRRIKLIKSKG